MKIRLLILIAGLLLGFALKLAFPPRKPPATHTIPSVPGQEANR